MNNKADALAKIAANSTLNGIFIFHPNIHNSDHIKLGNCHIHSAMGNIKPTTANIYNQILNNSKYQWSSQPSIWEKSHIKIKQFFLKIVINSIPTTICPRCNIDNEDTSHLLWDCPANNKKALIDSLHNIEEEAATHITRLLNTKSFHDKKSLILGGWWLNSIPISNPVRAKLILDTIVQWTWNNWKDRNILLNQ
eukprot:TRINITY_DN18828_c0_g2_i2.p2 TRINITY_DN18828_c0_g2~~TRINITY_DN18828_c0_g2_i2.p2  ORF type:complete len:195 (+),score=35.67 TRINITY_DN18828_c0_g2_i2:2076-2660(+)